jgi:hypothetical protein
MLFGARSRLEQESLEQEDHLDYQGDSLREFAPSGLKLDQSSFSLSFPLVEQTFFVHDLVADDFGLLGRLSFSLVKALYFPLNSLRHVLTPL